MHPPLRITLPTNDEILNRLRSFCANNTAHALFVYPHVALHGGQMRTPMQIIDMLKSAAKSYIYSAQCARMASAIASLDVLMEQLIDAVVPDQESADTVKAYWRHTR